MRLYSPKPPSRPSQPDEDNRYDSQLESEDGSETADSQEYMDAENNTSVSAQHDLAEQRRRGDGQTPSGSAMATPKPAPFNGLDAHFASVKAAPPHANVPHVRPPWAYTLGTTDDFPTEKRHRL